MHGKRILHDLLGGRASSTPPVFAGMLMLGRRHGCPWPDSPPALSFPDTQIGARPDWRGRRSAAGIAAGNTARVRK
eukprot:5463476-Alexandrium_andersonii.AAC.1